MIHEADPEDPEDPGQRLRCCYL